jgi:hypothetical protein
MSERPLPEQLLSSLKALIARLDWRRFGNLPPFESGDPLAGVRAPRAGGPRDRSGAIAMPEPGEDDLVDAHCRARDPHAAGTGVGRETVGSS